MKTVDHVALLVDDLDVAQKWYEDSLKRYVNFQQVLTVECVLTTRRWPS